MAVSCMIKLSGNSGAQDVATGQVNDGGRARMTVAVTVDNQVELVVELFAALACGVGRISAADIGAGRYQQAAERIAKRGGNRVLRQAHAHLAVLTANPGGHLVGGVDQVGGGI